jgi:mannose PTS system EIIA component
VTIGILALTHGELGLQFIETARLIGLSSEDGVAALAINPSDSHDQLRERVAQAIREVNAGEGVLILTDLFGGTPTNLSLAFLEAGKIEVVTGLNLPMFIKAVNSRAEHDLPGLARAASEAGRDSIYLAGQVLRERLTRRAGGSKS